MIRDFCEQMLHKESQIMDLGQGIMPIPHETAVSVLRGDHRTVHDRSEFAHRQRWANSHPCPWLGVWL
jgi:hypothetical protein